MNNYTVYKHTSPSGKVYIGITRQKTQTRWKRGRGYAYNPHFINAINKYGWSEFKHEIIAKGITKAEAESLEVKLIAEYNATDPAHGYNVALGGAANAPTDETKAKIRDSLVKAWSDHETREHITSKMTGVKRSEAAKKNISKAQKKRFKDPEQRRLVSERQKGRVRSEASNQKTSESLRRFYANDENLNRLRDIRKRQKHRTRAVYCEDTGETFTSVAEAAAKHSIAHQNIIKVCRGERARAGGYCWKYVEV